MGAKKQISNTLEGIISDIVCKEDPDKNLEITRALEYTSFLLSLNESLRRVGENLTTVVSEAIGMIGDRFDSTCSIRLDYDEDSEKFNFKQQSRKLPEEIGSISKQIRKDCYISQTPSWGVKLVGKDKLVLAHYTAPLTYEDKDGHQNKYGVLQLAREGTEFDQFERLILEKITRTTIYAVRNYYDQINAKTDPLTGAYNRGVLMKRLSLEDNNAVRNNFPYSILAFDLDHFKRINDTYGHSQGDEVLKQFTRLITSNLRGADTFVRTGGEEFAALLPRKDKNQAYEVAKTLRQLVEDEKFVNITDAEEPLRMTVSIGVSAHEDKTIDENVLDIADRRLYTAKEKRNTVCCR